MWLKLYGKSIIAYMIGKSDASLMVTVTLSREATPSKCFWLPHLKRVSSKRKEFAPCGSKFFPYRVDPFSEGDLRAVKQRESHESRLPWWNGGKSTRYMQVP